MKFVFMVGYLFLEKILFSLSDLNQDRHVSLYTENRLSEILSLFFYSWCNPLSVLALYEDLCYNIKIV